MDKRHIVRELQMWVDREPFRVITADIELNSVTIMLRREDQHIEHDPSAFDAARVEVEEAIAKGELPLKIEQFSAARVIAGAFVGGENRGVPEVYVRDRGVVLDPRYVDVLVERVLEVERAAGHSACSEEQAVFLATSAAELAHHVKNMRLALEEQAFAHQKAVASIKRSRCKKG